MRALMALALVVPALAGCATHIPVKQEFGASALLVAGADIPPDFASFNNADAAVNDLVADQICATPVQRLEERLSEAVPGRFEQLTSRCRTHVPLLGP